MFRQHDERAFYVGEADTACAVHPATGTMRDMKRLTVLLLLLPLLAGATEIQWMTVLLDGRKIGHSTSERRVIDDRVQSTQRMALTLERGGTRMQIRSEETSIESLTGQPLGFSGEVQMGGMARRYTGAIDVEGVLSVSMDGATEAQRLPWPKGALLAEGQRLAVAAAGNEATSLVLTIFLPDALQAAELSMHFTGEELVDMPEVGLVALRRIEQRLDLGDGEMTTESWVDAEQNVRRLRMPVFGTFIDMLACSQDCALAPVQPSDLMQRTLVAAPQALSRKRTSRALTYRLSANDDAELTLPRGAEQRSRYDQGSWLVSVHPGDSLGDDEAPHPALLQPNRWIESDADEIRQLAARAAADAGDELTTMQRLEQATRSHISIKSLRVGYASALETYRSREGDCTEHALLLAALGRARGIPTRIATGLVYSDQFAGHSRVFVPHAWTQAWIEGRWVSFDAAQDGFGSGHIKLAAGDGEPWRFYQGVSQLGRLQIESVEPAR